VYYETFGEIRAAIAREKEIKGWRREKKLNLIEKMNPKWKDLSAGWYSKAALQQLRTPEIPRIPRSG
jgi:putative endonuclease